MEYWAVSRSKMIWESSITTPLRASARNSWSARASSSGLISADAHAARGNAKNKTGNVQHKGQANGRDDQRKNRPPERTSKENPHHHSPFSKTEQYQHNDRKQSTRSTRKADVNAAGLRALNEQ